MSTADTASPNSLFFESTISKSITQTGDTTQAYLMQDQISLQEHLSQQHQGHSSSYVCEWMPTNVRLPSSQDSPNQDIYLCLPVHLSEASYFKQNEEKEEYKDDGYCNTTANQLRLMELDRYLAAVPPLALSTKRLLINSIQEDRSNTKSCHSFLGNVLHKRRRSKYDRQNQTRRSSSHCLITSTNSGRVINVLQGEIAHSTPSQADTLVSDDATTCHIVALWSCYQQSSGQGEQALNRSVLATMSHIDGVGYESCIRDAVNEHIKYHSMHSQHTVNSVAEECKDSSFTAEDSGGMIEMTVHIMGGFNDDESSSIAITDNVLQTFAALSNQCNDYMIAGRPPMRMTLATCAVASANDDGNGCPTGRGLAIDVATGNVFLAEVEETNLHESLPKLPSSMVASSNGTGAIAAGVKVQLLNASAHGPGVALRSARLWASAFHSRSRKAKNQLCVIHHPNYEYLYIEPFFFGPHAAARGLLDCQDKELLQLTSTSPDVEKSNFVSKVRQSLTYMNCNTSSKVFNGGQPMKFRRMGLNGWVAIG